MLLSIVCYQILIVGVAEGGRVITVVLPSRLVPAGNPVRDEYPRNGEPDRACRIVCRMQHCDGDCVACDTGEDRDHRCQHPTGVAASAVPLLN